MDPMGFRPFAGMDQLGNVQLLHVHLDEVHQHLWLVPNTVSIQLADQ